MTKVYFGDLCTDSEWSSWNCFLPLHSLFFSSRHFLVPFILINCLSAQFISSVSIAAYFVLLYFLSGVTHLTMLFFICLGKHTMKKDENAKNKRILDQSFYLWFNCINLCLFIMYVWWLDVQFHAIIFTFSCQHLQLLFQALKK